jgi:Ca-activated chloride channel family protein
MQISRVVVLIVGIALVVSPASAKTSSCSKLGLDVEVDKPVMPADKAETAYVRVGLTGFEMDCGNERAPVNIAVVIDKSGSMGGRKIEKAKEAAIMAIERLNCDDIVSVVVYDTEVRVLVPATKVTDKCWITRKIREIEANGSTALYGGVERGGRELKKFVCDSRVNRLVLLSDGLANVGPQTPHELGRLGERLIKKGISVTTIGLGSGYNEDLMTQLAYKSDGTHYFAENANDLARIFDKEFGRALSVVAQEIQTEIRCGRGIRPVRLLGRKGVIDGQNVSVFINQLYSKHEKFVLLEVEVPATERGERRKIATVNIRYDNMMTKKTDKLNGSVEVEFSRSKELVDSRTNSDVMVDVVELIAVERNELALELRDKGNIKEARDMLIDNESYLRSNSVKYNDSGRAGRLGAYAGMQREDADNLGQKDWTVQRKRMRGRQSIRKQQQ